MKNVAKYKRGYYMPPQECLDWTKKEYIIFHAKSIPSFINILPFHIITLL